MSGIRAKRKAATRATILRCASTNFCRLGFEATGMDEIADEANVAVGTLYNYFGSKKGLLVSMVARQANKAVKQGETVVAATYADPARSVTDLLEATVDRFFVHYDRELMQEVIAGAFARPMDRAPRPCGRPWSSSSSPWRICGQAESGRNAGLRLLKIAYAFFNKTFEGVDMKSLDDKMLAFIYGHGRGWVFTQIGRAHV